MEKVVEKNEEYKELTEEFITEKTEELDQNAPEDVWKIVKTFYLINKLFTMTFLGERGKEILTRLVNSIYCTGEFPEDFLVSIFIPPPKVNKTTQCNDLRTISLIPPYIKNPTPCNP
ncbi:hypothetical protein CAPTEDRAFT_201882 [Capitella teleta]|uniref:Uncharacterized protein n=1 Tax=Capitella teleta TaxID=283909 RepID=R7VKR9_CAPTE|nr:hypothetical protein CAPTEDRAFT_201882 [Capitella teleta]|eukprot:ELU17000.1 hypothetical protein CAPTEDRAFT_201882 [Capitella teleta]